MWSQFMKGKSKAKVKSKAKAKTNTATRASKPKKAAATLPAQLRELADWRTHALERMRVLILEADPEMIEERKWRKPSNPAGVPTFSHDGLVCTGETYKNTVKLTFAHGAGIPDPKRLFNASLDGNMRRAIDIPEGATIDARAFKALVQAAVARNAAAKKS
jgi:hypothetical protein